MKHIPTRYRASEMADADTAACEMEETSQEAAMAREKNGRECEWRVATVGGGW